MPAQGSITVNVASGSKIKLDAVERGLSDVFPGASFRIFPMAVELQDREGDVNAQPIGRDETVGYARMRVEAMVATYGKADVNVAIESGAIGRDDVAAMCVETREGVRTEFLSSAVPFPMITTGTGETIDPLEVAKERGVKTTTAGDVIHEYCPDIPGNNWHESVPVEAGGMSRTDQIASAFSNHAAEIRELLGSSIEAQQGAEHGNLVIE